MITAQQYAAERGAPSGACFIPHTTIAYHLDHGWSPDMIAVTVSLARWRANGTVERASRPTNFFAGWAFTFRGNTYRVHPESGQVLPHGTEPDKHIAMSDWAEHLARATTSVHFSHVRVPATLARGNKAENARRWAHRKQAAALLRWAPTGYALLPGQTTVAYKVIQAPDGVVDISYYRPRKDAIKATSADDALRHKRVKSYTGFFNLQGRCYEVFGDRLIERDCDHGARAEVASRAREVFDAQRPADARILWSNCVWYTVQNHPTRGIGVQFNWYDDKGARVTDTEFTKTGVIEFEQQLYEVQPGGKLVPLALEQQQNFMVL